MFIYMYLTHTCCVVYAGLPLEQYLAAHPLEHVDMSGCPFLTDMGMEYLCSARATLQSLSIAHCYYITDDCVDGIIGLPNLKCLDIRDCLQITPVSRERLLRRYPQAEVTHS